MPKKRIWIKRKDRVKQRYWIGQSRRKNYGASILSRAADTALHGTDRLKKGQREIDFLRMQLEQIDDPMEKERLRQLWYAERLDRKQIKKDISEGKFGLWIGGKTIGEGSPNPNSGILPGGYKGIRRALHKHPFITEVKNPIEQQTEKKNYGVKWKDLLRHDASIKQLEQEMEDLNKKRIDLQLKKNKLSTVQYKLRSPDSPLWMQGIDPFTEDDEETERKISFIERPFFVREKDKWKDRPEFKKWMKDENILWGKKPAEEAKRLVDDYKLLTSAEKELEKRQEELFTKIQNKKKAKSEEEDLKSI